MSNIANNNDLQSKSEDFIEPGNNLDNLDKHDNIYD